MSQTTNAPQFAWSVPTFLVSEVQQTADWYVQTLGFKLAGNFPSQPPYAYASLQRGYAELMLLSMAGYVKPKLEPPRPTGHWDAYIRLAGVETYYDELRARDDHAFITRDLQQQPYGNWEFAITEPNGYILVFGGTK